jgi:hypothetical protein
MAHMAQEDQGDMIPIPTYLAASLHHDDPTNLVGEILQPFSIYLGAA